MISENLEPLVTFSMENWVMEGGLLSVWWSEPAATYGDEASNSVILSAGRSIYDG